jgi:hypothetical protein
LMQQKSATQGTMIVVLKLTNKNKKLEAHS